MSPPQSVLPQPAQQALPLGGPRATPILSYLSDNDLRGPGLRSQSQELPEMDSFSSEDPRDTETSTSASTSDVGFLALAIGPNTSIEEEAQEDPQPLGLLPEIAHLAGATFVEQPGWRNLGIEDPDLPGGTPVHNHTALGSQKDHDEGEPEDRADGPEVTLERPLQDVLDLLRSVDPQPQLRELEFQLLSFRDRLKVGVCVYQDLARGSRLWGQPTWAGILGSVFPLSLSLLIRQVGRTMALTGWEEDCKRKSGFLARLRAGYLP